MLYFIHQHFNNIFNILCYIILPPYTQAYADQNDQKCIFGVILVELFRAKIVFFLYGINVVINILITKISSVLYKIIRLEIRGEHRNSYRKKISLLICTIRKNMQ